MTSRERVLAAIDHRQPDRVPIDLGAMRSTGITAVAYARLKGHLGITSGRTLVYDVVQQLAQPEQPILDFIGADVVDLGRGVLADPPMEGLHSPGRVAGRDPRLHRPPPARRRLCRLRSRRHSHRGHAARGLLSQPDAFPAPRLGRRSGRPRPASESDGPRHLVGAAYAALPQTVDPGICRRSASWAKYLFETTDYAIMAGFGDNLLEWGRHSISAASIIS